MKVIWKVPALHHQVGESEDMNQAEAEAHIRAGLVDAADTGDTPEAQPTPELAQGDGG